MSSIVNIAAYQFVPLDGLQALRARLLEKCRAWELRGTILLSPEGINLFVAGGEAEIELLLSELRKVPGLGRVGLEPGILTAVDQVNDLQKRVIYDKLTRHADLSGRRTARRLAARRLAEALYRRHDLSRAVSGHADGLFARHQPVPGSASRWRARGAPSAGASGGEK